MYHRISLFIFFFFNDPATTEIYTLSLHDALPIFTPLWEVLHSIITATPSTPCKPHLWKWDQMWPRSEEHTSELQSRGHLVCRLLLEKKKKKKNKNLT